MTLGRTMLYVCLTCLALISLLAVSETASAQEANAQKPVVVLETSKGPITIELDAARAPITAANFLKYVDEGFYDGVIFHRVIPGFMIQGGGMLPTMKEKPTRAPIKNEASNGLSNARGTIAMARTSNPDSATAQFFINHADNAGSLDARAGSAGYAVFGRVIDGMNVVDEIAKVPTGNKGSHGDVPLEPVTITSARRKTNP